MRGIFGRDSLWEDDYAVPTGRKRSLNVHTCTSIMCLFCLVTELKGLGDEIFGTLDPETTGRRVCEAHNVSIFRNQALHCCNFVHILFESVSLGRSPIFVHIVVVTVIINVFVMTRTDGKGRLLSLGLLVSNYRNEGTL
jgi:hypothetical protein